MTTQEIINKAIYIQFPKSSKEYKQYREAKDVHKLPLPGNMMYSTWKLNDNHFTTEYHRKYVLPLLNDLLHMKYNESDFHLVERHYENNDISMLYPNKECSFDIYSFEHDETSNNVTYDTLINSCNINNWRITSYHKLYKYPHECSHIINNYLLYNDRKLLISGDSQMIPVVSVLACYFKELMYLDNRSNKSFKKRIEEFNPTDVIIELNNDPWNKYHINNFK